MAIDFELTDAQKKLQATAREFANECLPPVVSAADHEADTQKAFLMMREPYREAYKNSASRWVSCRKSSAAAVSAMSTCNWLSKK